MTMAFSRSHNLQILITFFLLVLIPYAVSITFNLTKIGPQNQNRDIVTEGDGAYISDTGIQVTPDGIGSDRRAKAGRATYIRPLHLWDYTSGELASFTTEFSFVIDSNGDVDYADGLTFFLAENNSVMLPGGAMGLPLRKINDTASISTNPFVAVEFDTYYNGAWDPVEFVNNTIRNHVGININSVVSIRAQQWLSNVTGGGLCHACVRYDSVSKNLSVCFTGFQNGTTIREDGVFYEIDLRDVLPEWVIFGFSAATGLMFEKNSVRSWSFNSSEVKVYETNELPPSAQPPNGQPLYAMPPELQPPYEIPMNTGPDAKKRKLNKVEVIVILCGSVTFLAVVAFILWRTMKTKTTEDEVPELVFTNELIMGTGPKRFSYRKLARSTSKFSENEKLGEGGFGGVYKGFLKESNMYVAVKRVSKTSQQGIKEYASEVMIISRLSHRNLVQLIGWCHEKGELLLVYEFMENGSLDLHLFQAKSLLTWTTRYKIAHGLASALLYLHEEWEQCVLHRDIKSSNVMLDSSFNAKLGDFGLAKLVDHEKGWQTTILGGTLGYMAPECAVTGRASKESDVFSFGVVALEIACGRKPIDYLAPENQIRLAEWVWELYGAGSLIEAVDSRLCSDYVVEEIKCLMIVGLWCVHPDPNFRPSIKQAIKVLNYEASLPILPPKMPVASYLS